MPASNAGDDDPTIDHPYRLPPPPNGTIFRIIEYPPDSVRVAALRERGSEHAQDAASDGYVRDVEHQRHPGFHKTSSIDYALILSGEIYALMDEGEVLLKAGDVLIQRGTNHAWSNRTDQPCTHRLRADRRRALVSDRAEIAQRPAPSGTGRSIAACLTAALVSGSWVFLAMTLSDKRLRTFGVMAIRSSTRSRGSACPTSGTALRGARANSAGEPSSAWSTRLSRKASNSGSRSTACTSALIFSTRSFGVPARANSAERHRRLVSPAAVSAITGMPLSSRNRRLRTQPQDLELAGAVMRQRDRRAHGDHVDMAGEHVVERRRDAAIMHRRHLHARHVLQQQRAHVRRGARSRRAVIDRAGLGLGQFDQLVDRLGLYRGMRHDRHRNAGHAGDGHEIGLRIEGLRAPPDEGAAGS